VVFLAGVSTVAGVSTDEGQVVFLAGVSVADEVQVGFLAGVSTDEGQKAAGVVVVLLWRIARVVDGLPRTTLLHYKLARRQRKCAEIV